MAWQDKKRKHWVADHWVLGERYTKRGFATKKEARDHEKTEEKKLRKENLPILRGTGYSVRIVASMYLDYSEIQHVPQTYEYKSLVLRKFCAFKADGVHESGDLIVDELIPYDITQFLQTAQTKHEWNFFRKELHACFQWYITEHLRNIANPAKACKRSGHTPKERTPLTDEYICMMLEEAEARQDDHDLLVFHLCTLARPDEGMRARWKNWNREERTIKLWTRKRKDGEWHGEDVPVPDPLHEVLCRMYDNRKQDKWIFYNEKTKDRYYKRPKFMTGICKRAMIPPIEIRKRKIRGKERDYPIYWGLHDLRHFMAAVLKGEVHADTAKISRYLRHQSIRTTEIYFQTLRVDITDTGKSVGQLPFLKNSHPTVTSK